jgi:hypothetical protein
MLSAIYCKCRIFTVLLGVIMLSIVNLSVTYGVEFYLLFMVSFAFYCFAGCFYAECPYALPCYAKSLWQVSYLYCYARYYDPNIIKDLIT